MANKDTKIEEIQVIETETNKPKEIQKTLEAFDKKDKRKPSKMLNDLFNELETIVIPECQKIKAEMLEYNTKKMATQYQHQIIYRVAFICNRNDIRISKDKAFEFYSIRNNAQTIYDKILNLISTINSYGVDFELNKKILCMLMGISLDTYDDLLGETRMESYPVFCDMEEFLINVKTMSAEVGSRNLGAIKQSLSMSTKYGGHAISFDSNVIDTKPSISTNQEKAKEVLENRFKDL